MISYVKGELVYIAENSIILENGGIGFDIRVPGSVIEQLPPIGKDVKIYTYMYVREDAILLYGFLTRDELEMFQMILQVNGIGPKGALGILTVMNADQLRFAIISQDSKSIAKAPGIGSKTASKLILELKDKCKAEDIFNRNSMDSATGTSGLEGDVEMTSVRNDAIQALVALGYSSTEALQAVKQVTIIENMTVEQVLKQSLKKL